MFCITFALCCGIRHAIATFGIKNYYICLTKLLHLVNKITTRNCPIHVEENRRESYASALILRGIVVKKGSQFYFPYGISVLQVKFLC